MKPSGAKKAARKISPSQVQALVKHLGGKPMTRSTKFAGAKEPKKVDQPKPHKLVAGRVDPDHDGDNDINDPKDLMD